MSLRSRLAALLRGLRGAPTASEALLRQVIDASPNRVAVKDAHGRYVVANQAAADAFGLPVEALLGSTGPELAGTGDAAPLDAADRHVLLTGQPALIAEEIFDAARGEMRCFQTRKVRMDGPTPDAHKLLFISEDITARRATEQQLAESQAWTQRILESITDAMFVVDDAWFFTRVNTQAEVILGKSAAELIGHGLWDLYADAIDTDFYYQYHEAIAAGDTVSFEEYYPSLNAWYSVRAYPFEGGLAVYFTDVTEARQRESFLRLRQERMQFLYEVTTQQDVPLDDLIEQTLRRTADLFGMEIGVLSFVEDDVFTVVSALTPDEMPMPPGTTFPLGDTICSRTIEGNTIVAEHHISTSEMCVLPAYERYRVESYIGMPLFVGGQKYGTLAFSSLLPHEPFTDVDIETMHLLGQWVAAALLQQQSLDALRESEERFRLVAESMQDLVCLHAPDGTYQWISPSVKPLLGYAPGELLGTTPYALFHPDDLERIRTASHMPVLTGEEASEPFITYRIRHRDGYYLWFETLTDPVYDAEGAVTQLQTTSRNVTARVETMEALKDARAQAESADRAKSAFLANMSHEIRTPLNGIVGVAQLLDSTAVTDAQREYVNILQASSDTLLTLINDILDLSKIEAGHLDLAPERFCPATLARESLDLVCFKAREKNLDFVLDVAPSVPEGVVGDDARLRQVLLNLLSNAIKFTPEGQVTLRVTASAVAGDAAALTFAVEDQGIGIPEGKLDSLFQRFNQLDTSRTKRYGGTGLGLAISKQLIGLMGGTIGATSTPGEGSTFTFTVTLPLAQPLAESPADAEAATLTPAEHLAGLRLLIVEDNRVNQRVLLRMLETIDLTADVAANGIEALEKLAAQPYDVVFMDVQMPEMDGYTCTAAIHETPAPHPWIIGLTANALAGDREDVLAAGMDDYVPKPLRKDALEQALLRVPMLVG